MFRNTLPFTVRKCWHLAQPPSWRTTPYRMSAKAFSIYSQLPFIFGGRSSIRKLRMRHAAETGTHISWSTKHVYQATKSIYLLIDQPRGLVVRASGYKSRGPGFDSRLYNGDFPCGGEDPRGDHGLGS